MGKRRITDLWWVKTRKGFRGYVDFGKAVKNATRESRKVLLWYAHQDWFNPDIGVGGQPRKNRK